MPETALFGLPPLAPSSRRASGSASRVPRLWLAPRHPSRQGHGPPRLCTQPQPLISALAHDTLPLSLTGPPAVPVSASCRPAWRWSSGAASWRPPPPVPGAPLPVRAPPQSRSPARRAHAATPPPRAAAARSTHSRAARAASRRRSRCSKRVSKAWREERGRERQHIHLGEPLRLDGRAGVHVRLARLDHLVEDEELRRDAGAHDGARRVAGHAYQP